MEAELPDDAQRGGHRGRAVERVEGDGGRGQQVSLAWCAGLVMRCAGT